MCSGKGGCRGRCTGGQPLANPLTCLGDGHDGIWNLLAEIGDESQRQEILDWFHRKENLYKIKAAEQELAAIETLLWHGKVNDAMGQLQHWQDDQAQNFIA